MNPNPVRARRCRTRGVIQGIAGATLAIVAEWLIFARVSGHSVEWIAVAVLFALACALTWRAVGLFDRAATATCDAIERPEMPPAGHVAARLLLGVASIAANLGAVELFASDRHLDLAWLLYAASLAGAIIALISPSIRGDRARSVNIPRHERIGLGVVLLAAAVLRFYRIGDLPAGLWSGEAQLGLLSERILSDPGFRPVWLAGVVHGSALLLYWQSAALFAFGPTTLALRIVPAVAGMLGVIAAYLLGRALFGWRTGLVTGVLLAVSSWHVGFSRIDVSAIWASTFDAFAVYFLVQGLNRGRLSSFGLAGLCLALGIHSSLTTSVFCVVLLAYIAHRAAFDRVGINRRWHSGLAVLVALFILTMSPLAEFATLQPASFVSEVVDGSVVPEIQREGSLAPVVRNAASYLSMFNVQGDPNGRNNLAGWPELDEITGGLFVVGLIVCLRRWKRSNHFLPLVSLVVISVGGALSATQGAPDSAQTIDNALSCALIAAIPIGLLWSESFEARMGQIWRTPHVGIASLSTGAAVALALLGWITAVNVQRYFVAQANDVRSYSAFSVAPTLAAEEVRRFGSSFDAYLSPGLIGDPAFKFLRSSSATVRPFDSATTLPLHVDRSAMFLFTADDATDVDAVRQFYPAAVLGTDRPGPTDPVVLYLARVSSIQISALRGLDGTLTPAGSIGGVATRRVDGTINFNWSTRTPLPVPFSGSWKGVITAPTFGSYRFRLEAPANAILKIDERDILQGTSATSVSLAQGRHSLDLTARFDDPTRLQLWWTVPGRTEEIVPALDLFRAPATNRGLLGSFFSNRSWSGNPILQRVDLAPGQDMSSNAIHRPFSVNWTGKIDIPRTGLYRFGTRSVDFSWLYLDNKLVVDNSHGRDEYVDEAVELSQGLHDFRLSYLDQGDDGFVRVYWQPPGYPLGLLPFERLFPPQGAYPERAGPLAPHLLTPSTEPASAPSSGVVNVTRPPGALPVSPLPIKLAFGVKGTGPGQLSDPRGIAVDGQGDIFVVDTGNRRIDEFSPDGKAVREIGQGGAGDGQFDEPVAAVVNPDGELVVLDSISGWISRFSTSGAFLGKFAGPSVGFYHPRGIAIDASGNYYVANTGSAQVDVFNSAGALVRRVNDASPGRQPLQPVGVAVAPDGSLFMSDVGNFLLVRFDPRFAEAQTWALPPSDSVHGPQLALNPVGDLYVSDPTNHRVIHLGPDGPAIDQLGADGQLSLPVGITTDFAGNVYVVDADASKVVVYGR